MLEDDQRKNTEDELQKLKTLWGQITASMKSTDQQIENLNERKLLMQTRMGSLENDIKRLTAMLDA